MNPLTVGVFAALCMCLGTTYAQSPYECSELDQNVWVTKGNFARKKGNCQDIYFCSNGQPQYVAPCPPSTYYSLELGVCAWKKSVAAYNSYSTDDCQSEELKYNAHELKRRRDEVCNEFKTKFGNGPNVTRLFSGDYQNCRFYFNCQTHNGNEGYFTCPGATSFNEDDGECNYVSKCNTKPNTNP